MWEQWLTSSAVPDRYSVFFTCPTTRLIKIVRPTGIEFSKSSDHYPADQCNGLSLCHTNFIGTRHFHMRPKIVTDLLWWIWWYFYVEILNRNPMSNKIISYITLHSLSSPWLGLGPVQAQVTQSQSTNNKTSGRAARYPSVEIERKNTVLGFPIEDEFLVLVNHCYCYC